jgi:hypothetical protein
MGTMMSNTVTRESLKKLMHTKVARMTGTDFHLLKCGLPIRKVTDAIKPVAPADTPANNTFAKG